MGIKSLHIHFLCCLIIARATGALAQPFPGAKVAAISVSPAPGDLITTGILGEAISSSRDGRLKTLPAWNDGELIKMFAMDARAGHDRTDWYGEHAGKWLCAAAHAAAQRGDADLKDLVMRTADYLVSTQEADGYIGTYSPAVRFTNDEAVHTRSWDVWNVSYLTLGLLQVNRYFPRRTYLDAAIKSGELFLKTFGDGSRDITAYGTRHGVSATIILDPIMELYRATGNRQYLDLAEGIVGQMEKKEGLRLVTVARQHGDMTNVGDGKAYQIIWNLTALAKLYEATGQRDYLEAVQNAWQNIHDYHLTIAGGPWGGIGKHKECFNDKYFWTPYGFVETCSTMAWIQLNKQMLHLTGEAKYAQELERAAYNALPGAQFRDGENWCYHSFSNGSENAAHFNDCCPSSGALALEEVSSVIYSVRKNGIACNVYTPGKGHFRLGGSLDVRVEQKTAYPADGTIELTFHPSKTAAFPVSLRIPDWCQHAVVSINGKPAGADEPEPGSFYEISRTWRAGDVVSILFPMDLRVHHRQERAGAPQGGHDLYRVDWFALTRGPLVFATHGLIDGNNRERVFSLPASQPEASFEETEVPAGYKGPAYTLKTHGDPRLVFLPYYEAAGDEPGAWRLTWIQNGVE